MSGIFGVLGLSDSDRSFVNTIGQSAVYEATQTLLERYNTDMNAALAVFMERQTTDFKWRYKLPGGGRLQRRGGKAESAAVKAYGQYDVAFPLEDFGAQVAVDDVTMAYMTMQEYDRHLDTVLIQDANTVRYELLKVLFNDTADTFTDPIHGDLTIEHLADGDGDVTYPPVIGSESDATEDHYLFSGYVATAISDTNNPYVTIREDIEHHFYARTGGDNIVVFIHPDETPETEDLTDFDAIPDRFVRPGTQTHVPVNLPAVPGKVLGRTNGCWVSEWRWMPTGYMLGIHLEVPAPVIMRIDEVGTGLMAGLQLVTRDENYPIEAAHFRHRFGFGCGNRLSGCMMGLDASSWSIPSGYGS